MRKLILTIAVVAASAASFVAMPQAQAQQQYPSVAGLTPFSPQCNFMSKAGYLRYRYFITSGRWISYEEANRVAAEQG